jgi:hypothetical protein
MTGMAEDQCFASAGSHDLYPVWFLPAIILLQVFQSPDLMHFNLFSRAAGPAYLTDLRQESLF